MTLHRSIVRGAVLALVALSCSAPAIAAEGWGMPNLNPFARKSGASTSSRVSDNKSSLWPKWGGGNSRRATGPSTWNRVTTGTKNAWRKTTSAINPWDNDTRSPAPEPKPSGSFNPFSQTSAKKSKNEKSKSFLPSWGGGEEESKEPKTVNDFLAMPKPEF